MTAAGTRNQGECAMEVVVNDRTIRLSTRKGPQFEIRNPKSKIQRKSKAQNPNGMAKTDGGIRPDGPHPSRRALKVGKRGTMRAARSAEVSDFGFSLDFGF